MVKYPFKLCSITYTRSRVTVLYTIRMESNVRLRKKKRGKNWNAIVKLWCYNKMRRRKSKNIWTSFPKYTLNLYTNNIILLVLSLFQHSIFLLIFIGDVPKLFFRLVRRNNSNLIWNMVLPKTLKKLLCSTKKNDIKRKEMRKRQKNLPQRFVVNFVQNFSCSS